MCSLKDLAQFVRWPNRQTVIKLKALLNSACTSQYPLCSTCTDHMTRVGKWPRPQSLSLLTSGQLMRSVMNPKNRSGFECLPSKHPEAKSQNMKCNNCFFFKLLMTRNNEEINRRYFICTCHRIYDKYYNMFDWMPSTINTVREGKKNKNILMD